MINFFVKSIKKHFSLRSILEKQNTICLLDEKYFFVHEITLDAAIRSKREIEKFIFLKIEEICPFSLDEILCGYFFDKTKHSAVIFTAYKQIVERTHGPLNKYSYIFPNFLCKLICHKNFDITRAKISRNEQVVFLNSDSEIKLSLTSDVIFNANLQSIKTKSRIRNIKYLSSICEFGSYICLAALFALTMITITLFTQHFKFRKIESKISKNAKEVSNVISKHILLQNIDEFFSFHNFCLNALNGINQVRPDDILFTDVQINSKDLSLRTRGRASSVGLVKDYRESVKKLENVKDAIASNMHSKDHSVSFNLEIKFN